MFDGHGGREVADFAAKHLHDEVLREVCKLKRGEENLDQVEGDSSGDDSRLPRDRQASVSRGASERRGATATTAYLRGGRIWVANVGDCRAVICEGGKARALTVDHRPDKTEEREAVERRGGEVVKIFWNSTGTRHTRCQPGPRRQGSEAVYYCGARGVLRARLRAVRVSHFGN